MSDIRTIMDLLNKNQDYQYLLDNVAQDSFWPGIKNGASQYGLKSISIGARSDDDKSKIFFLTKWLNKVKNNIEDKIIIEDTIYLHLLTFLVITIRHTIINNVVVAGKPVFLKDTDIDAKDNGTLNYNIKFKYDTTLFEVILSTINWQDGKTVNDPIFISISSGNSSLHIGRRNIDNFNKDNIINAVELFIHSL